MANVILAYEKSEDLYYIYKPNKWQRYQEPDMDDYIEDFCGTVFRMVTGFRRKPRKPIKVRITVEEVK